KQKLDESGDLTITGPNASSNISSNTRSNTGKNHKPVLRHSCLWLPVTFRVNVADKNLMPVKSPCGLSGRKGQTGRNLFGRPELSPAAGLGYSNSGTGLADGVAKVDISLTPQVVL